MINLSSTPDKYSKSIEDIDFIRNYHLLSDSILNSSFSSSTSSQGSSSSTGGYKLIKYTSTNANNNSKQQQLVDVDNNNNNYETVNYNYNNKDYSSKKRDYNKDVNNNKTTTTATTFKFKFNMKSFIKYIFFIIILIIIFEIIYYFHYTINCKSPYSLFGGSGGNRLYTDNINSTTNNGNDGLVVLSEISIAQSTKKKFNNLTLLIVYEEQVKNNRKDDSTTTNDLHDDYMQLYVDKMTNQYKKLKESFVNMYKSVNYLIEGCPLVPDTLQGPLDLDLLFNNMKLAQLIEFYESKNKEKTKDQAAAAAASEQQKIISTTTNTSELLEITKETFILNDLNKLDQDLKIYAGNVSLGGSWRPSTCKSREKLAVIIPYRNRYVHLAILIRHLHLILQRQFIEYRIFVTEQFGNLTLPFNKGRIMNAAYIEILKIDPTFECFVFHDVDLVLEDDRNIYTCSKNPRHMSVAIDKFNYVLPYSYLVGGVFILQKKHFLELNGYSNQYWGWGAEDDDMYERIVASKLKLSRPSPRFARYKMIKHDGQTLNPERLKILQTANKRYRNDGLNTVKYVLLETRLYSTFTHFMFDVRD